eukprot:1161691-Pelagomonas_calceolata.AAC.3
MLAVRNTLYCLYTNVLRSMVQDWCVKYNIILSDQLSFFPGRNTLQPLLILRHLQHAAQSLQPQGPPRLYATFIDFKQAYDSILRVRLWEHLQKCQMPSQLISIIKGLYKMTKTSLLTETNGRVSSQRTVLNKDAFCHHSYSLFT